MWGCEFSLCMATGDGTCDMGKWEGRTCMHGRSESHGGFTVGARRPVRGGKIAKLGQLGDMQVACGLGLDNGA